MGMLSEGRIRNLQQLKSAYRSLVMMTHPDAAGSDRLTDAFVRLSSDYEEARDFLEARVPLGQSPALRDHLLLLIQDMEAGAAVFGSSRPMPLARRLEARRDRQ
jgi:hypothetical protein